MKLLKYYGYIYRMFAVRSYSKEETEDLTQGFFVHALEHKDQIGEHISLKFIKVAVTQFFVERRQYAGRQRRKGTMLPMDLIEEEYMDKQDIFQVQEKSTSTLYTKQLFKIVESLSNIKLKSAIALLLDQGFLSKANAAEWDILRRYRSKLRSLA